MQTNASFKPLLASFTVGAGSSRSPGNASTILDKRYHSISDIIPDLIELLLRHVLGVGEVPVQSNPCGKGRGVSAATHGDDDIAFGGRNRIEPLGLVR